MQHSPFLTTALTAVQAAEEIILKYYLHNVRVETKVDKTPVTVADREVEQRIKEIISAAHPDHGFIGEEYGVSSNEAEYKWIIDPIDGTKNFTRDLPYFATQLALMRGDEVVVGVANWPILKQLMYAERGKGAFLNNDQIHVSKVTSIDESYFCHGGIKYFERMGLSPQAAKLSEAARFSRGWGAEFGQLYLPSGQLDIHVDGWIKIWDIAAFVVILEEAGGKISDMKGNPISLETTNIIATNGYLHDQVVEYFRP